MNLIKCNLEDKKHKGLTKELTFIFDKDRIIIINNNKIIARLEIELSEIEKKITGDFWLNFLPVSALLDKSIADVFINKT